MESVKLDAEKLVQLRTNTKLHLLQNPNYFGTFKDKALMAQYQPVQLLSNYQSYYEELGCIDYRPETRTLGAVVTVKQPTGYGSDACGGGTREYVRFFVDYNNNNTWIDEGLAEIGVYNHSFGDDLCYYAQITLDPNKISCCQDEAVLPNVRAILSWNIVPTAGDPNFAFIWGDVKEAKIQVAPSGSIWCHIKDLLTDIQEVKVNPELFVPAFEKKYLPGLQEKTKMFQPVIKPTLSPVQLKKLYGSEVSESRIAHTSINQHLKAANFEGSNLAAMLTGFDIQAIIDFHIFPRFNTDHEELHCVSLNRDMDTLHASVQIKRKNGYLGGLCTAGSKEYVAFYMDFGAGWEYMGTGSTTVHDIPGNDVDGLWYDVAKTINLDQHRKAWCEVGKAKLKGILSWNVAPTPNNPNYIAAYGDWETCNVEVKPIYGDVNGLTTILEKVGGMVVADIDDLSGLATTNFAGSLGGAVDSPFYGSIELIGHIFFPLPNMSYRFIVTKPGGIPLPLTDHQTITTDTSGVFLDVEIDPDAQGWIPYLQTPSTNIVGGLLARYNTGETGKHTIRMQAKDAASNIYNDPNGAVTILIDATAPVVHINIDPAIGGDCADYLIGASITGTYSMSDAHVRALTVSVTPGDLGATVTVNGTTVNTESYGTFTLSDGFNAGTFEINTGSAAKCGYNVRIDAADRTIINSHSVSGHHSSEVKGFCLRETTTS